MNKDNFRDKNMVGEKDKLTEAIIGCAFRVSNTLGSGFFEKVYENALAIELKTTGINCEQQKSIPETYRGVIVGDYYTDKVVEEQVILESKATKTIDEIHKAQLLNHLKATGLHRGLTLNYGTSKLGVIRLVF